MSENNETTKLRLAYAMNECMKKNSVESITVKQISDQAKCSRQTFYRCFSDKFDLINWYFDRILHESFERMGQGRNVQDALSRKFQYIQDEKLFFKAAFSYDQQNSLRTHDFEMIYAFYLNLLETKLKQPIAEEDKEVLEMYCYSSVYKTVQWVLHGTNTSIPTLVNIMIQAIPESLKVLFQEAKIL